MYVPAEHGLTFASLVRRRRGAAAPFPLSAPRRWYFYRARNAIYHVFRGLGFGEKDIVLMPDYHNTNEVAAVRASGAAVRFYRVGRNLEPDMEGLARLVRSTDARALFVIHYFGWPQPIKELLALCDAHGLLLFEDCALSLLGETLGGRSGRSGSTRPIASTRRCPSPTEACSS